jgi:hypothetical protein
MEKGKIFTATSFYRKCIPLFVNVFLKGKLKVIYEVSRREDYFKFRFTGKRLILKRDISGSFPIGKFQKLPTSKN